ncbi:MAG: 4-aminobutyrate--2-oxoglutarate transaminase [Elusimicrobia bacterium]|nr:4-aminobutyrate--2-oxoglutarate transaminase [Elusimicrobiota bacterium]
MLIKEGKKLRTTSRGRDPKLAPNGCRHSSKLAGERESWVPRGVSSYHSFTAESGSNALVKDVDGRSYIDFAGGIGALNVGHCHPRVVEAVRRQAQQLLHMAFPVAGYCAYAKVCRRLCEAAPGSFPKKAALFNSGAEAVENAVKVARSHTRRPGIVSFDMSFHGRTYLAVGLTGKHKPYRQKFGPFPGELYRIPYPYAYRPPDGVRAEDLTRYCLGRLENLFSTSIGPDQIAAIIIEPVLGEGGFVVPPADFIPSLRRVCDKHGILLIADEVQTGFGRTGKMFAIEHSGAAPDVLVVAKSLAAGLPLSGIVGRAEVLDSVEAGGLGGTYGGNPVACAAAMAVFDILEEERLIERASRIGKKIERRFDALVRSCPTVGESRGLGAMRALELVEDRKTKEPLPESDMKAILSDCAREGLLIIRAGQHGNVLRCLVPLTIPFDQLERGLDILEAVLRDRKP